MLKTGTIEVAKEAEKGIIELETLKKINNDLISTIDETIKIQEEGKKKRKEAEGELSRMEDEIKSKLLEIRQEGKLCRKMKKNRKKRPGQDGPTFLYS